MISSALNHILIHSLSDQKRGNCSEANSHFGQQVGRKNASVRTRGTAANRGQRVRWSVRRVGDNAPRWWRQIGNSLLPIWILRNRKIGK